MLKEWYKGWKEEKRVYKKLKKLGKEYKILKNITINTRMGSTQIDFILASKYGVFTLEVKNYTGVVYANSTNVWKKRNRVGKIYNIYSPIRQNEGHINVLKYHLKKWRDNKYHKSIIVFHEGVVIENNIYSNIVSTSEMLDYIKSFKEKCLSDKEVESIINIINNVNDKSLFRRFKHNKEVQSKSRAIFDKSNICPVCGGLLVKREGKYGEFIGCKEYPNCTFTRKI